MGAFTYRQRSSIRSTAGGICTPGGEGVEYSPTSPTILATVPSKVHTARFALAPPAWPPSAPGRWQRRPWPHRNWRGGPVPRAWLVLRANPTQNLVAPVRPGVGPRLRHWRPRCRLLSPRLPAVSTLGPGRRLWACWSSFQSFIRSWPFDLVALLHSQCLDAPTQRAGELGALAGFDRAARVLAMLDSTRPLSTVATTTAMGLGRLAHQRAPRARQGRAGPRPVGGSARKTCVRFQSCGPHHSRGWPLRAWGCGCG